MTATIKRTLETLKKMISDNMPSNASDTMNTAETMLDSIIKKEMDVEGILGVVKTSIGHMNTLLWNIKVKVARLKQEKNKTDKIKLKRDLVNDINNALLFRNRIIRLMKSIITMEK